MEPLHHVSHRLSEATPPVAPGDARLRRILVVNSKGGCGKTTLATNLASFYACRGDMPALFDYDPQGSSTQWLSLRAREPAIHGVAAYRRSSGQTQAFQMRVPEATRRIILDAPAGVTGPDLIDLVRRVDVILIPVQPSPFDMHAAAHFIRDLLLVGRVRAHAVRVGVVANRVRSNTHVYKSLLRFLKSLDIPFVARLRDTQNYVKAARDGLGAHELSSARIELADWTRIVDWIEQDRLPPID